MKTIKNFAFVAIMMAGAAVSFTSCSSASNDAPKAPVTQTAKSGSNTNTSSSTSANGLSADIYSKIGVLDPKNELTADQRAELETMFKSESTRVMTNETEDAIYDASVGITKGVVNKMKQYVAAHTSLKSTEVGVFCKVKVTYTSAKKGDDLDRDSEIHFRQLDYLNNF